MGYADDQPTFLSAHASGSPDAGKGLIGHPESPKRELRGYGLNAQQIAGVTRHPP